MLKIYLAGFISGNKIKECTGWRIEIREHYDNYSVLRNFKYGSDDYKKDLISCQNTIRVVAKYPIDWLDPLNGKELNSIDAQGLKSACPVNSIVHRDYMSVSQADIIVANMDTFGEQRPLTGTICELAWAWDKHKPIIMITNEAKYKDHPFLSYFASVIVKDVQTLIEEKIINHFYKGVHSAIY